MKIIHLVLGKANPLRMNGVNKLVHEMVAAQKKLHPEVCLWGITKNLVHDYPERGFETVLFPSLMNKTKIHPSLIAAIEKLEDDVVFHFHGSFIPEFYRVSRLLVQRGIAYVYTPHGALTPEAMQRRAWKKMWYFRFFEKKIVEDAGVVIFTGKSGFDSIDNLAKVKQKLLIPNGQPLLPFQAENFEKCASLNFCYCGRIDINHKGLDLLLEGFRIFLDKGGQAHLHLVGDGREMPKLQNLASKLNLQEHLTFHGAKYGDEKFMLLAQAHVFVHTSLMEGFPASVLEAAALGLPCLVSEATNTGDYIEKYHCGFVLNQNTPAAIARAMLKAEQKLISGHLKQMGSNARTMVEVEFDWKKICGKILEAYEHLLHAPLETLNN